MDFQIEYRDVFEMEWIPLHAFSADTTSDAKQFYQERFFPRNEAISKGRYVSRITYGGKKVRSSIEIEFESDGSKCVKV